MTFIQNVSIFNFRAFTPGFWWVRVLIVFCFSFAIALRCVVFLFCFVCFRPIPPMLPMHVHCSFLVVPQLGFL